MTIQRKPANIIRRSVSKRQPRPPKPPKDFPREVKAIIAARSGGQCEIGDCTAAAVHHHHRRPRGSGGTSLAWVNKAGNALHLCLEHHAFAESHRTCAYVQGWLISQHRTDAVAVDVPVLRRGRSVLLGDDGSVRSVGGAA